MNPNLKASAAKPCAWAWHCPECKVRVIVMNTGAGLSFKSPPCSHAIAPVMDGGVVSVSYTDPE